MGTYTRDRGDPAKVRLTLEGQAEIWATPTVPNGGRVPTNLTIRGASGYRPDGSKAQISLELQSRHWSTPTAHDGRRPGADLHSTQDRNLSREAANWPTPSVMLTGERTSPEAFARRQAKLKEKHAGRTGNGAGPDLAMVAKTWSMPKASDGEKGGPGMRGSKGDIPLPAQAVSWPTPNMADHKTSQDYPHKGGNPTLVMAAAHFPSSGAPPWRPNLADHP